MEDKVDPRTDHAGEEDGGVRGGEGFGGSAGWCDGVMVADGLGMNVLFGVQ